MAIERKMSLGGTPYLVNTGSGSPTRLDLDHRRRNGSVQRPTTSEIEVPPISESCACGRTKAFARLHSDWTLRAARGDRNFHWPSRLGGCSIEARRPDLTFWESRGPK